MATGIMCTIAQSVFPMNITTAETLTDKNGEFKLPGFGWHVFSNVGAMDLTIFKAGYSQIESTSWSLCIEPGFRPMTWDGKKLTIKLHRLSEEELRHRRIALPHMTPNKKRKLLIIERNKELTERGYPPHYMLPLE